VIQSATDDGVNVLLLKALAPVRIALGLGEFLADGSQSLLVDIAEGDYVFVGDPLEMVSCAVPGGLLLGASAPKSLRRGRISPDAPIKAADLRNWRRLTEGAVAWPGFADGCSPDAFIFMPQGS
jgi:hypothetical protein